MRQRTGPSLTEDVYHQLRSAVLHGDLAAGDRLPLDALARRYDVSVGVVREVVTRLASERLVEAIPQSGFRVRPASAEHLADLTWARCQIERLAVTESINHGDTTWEGALVAAHHVLSVTTPRLPDTSPNPRWMDAHRSFHAALVGGCPNSTLLVVRQQLFDEAELYRHRSATEGLPVRDVAAEHSELVDAALRHDAPLAASLLVAHLQLTAQLAGDAENSVVGAPPGH